MMEFNIQPSELLKEYCQKYGSTVKSNISDLSSNFYHMLNNKRNGDRGMKSYPSI